MAAAPAVIQGGSQKNLTSPSISRPILPSSMSGAAAAAAAVRSKLLLPACKKLWGFFSPPFDPRTTTRRCRRAPPSVSCRPSKPRAPRARARVSEAHLREQWLCSLSCPLPDAGVLGDGDGVKFTVPAAAASEWVIGVDPDLSGAVAVLKADGSAQVFDSPYVQVLIAKGARKRLDARSIIQLLRGFGAPPGTTAYIEQSNPFPQDGKQGWWSGGFTYGLWIGILVASGFSVVPVPSNVWKNYFELCHGSSCKDDSRKAASLLFPDLVSLLKRKRDHGRAEALLIAAYGKGLPLPSDQSPPLTTQSTTTLIETV